MSTSTTTTSEPAVPVKKRGRPKKVVDKAAGEVKKTSVRKASTKTSPSAKEKAAEKAAEKKSATASATATAAPKKNTPSTSKILQEVAQKGTLKVTPTPPSSPPPPPLQKPPPISRAPSSPARTGVPLPPSQPPSPRISTIPLPSKPSNPYNLAAPTPPSRPVVPEVAPTPTPTPAPAPRTQAYDGKLPPQYKPAARRVTAIMVGIPIILVVGYELYQRFDRTIRTKYETPGNGKPA